MLGGQRPRDDPSAIAINSNFPDPEELVVELSAPIHIGRRIESESIRPLPLSGSECYKKGQSAWSTGKSMRCMSCGSENPDSKRLCGDFGSSLGSRCARYGVENPAGKKFCSDCGADLSQPTAAPRSAESRAVPFMFEHSKPHEVGALLRSRSRLGA
jgi:hypothetical protein